MSEQVYSRREDKHKWSINVEDSRRAIVANAMRLLISIQTPKGGACLVGPLIRPEQMRCVIQLTYTRRCGIQKYVIETAHMKGR